MLQMRKDDPFKSGKISFLKTQRKEKEEALKQIKEKEKKGKRSIS